MEFIDYKAPGGKLLRLQISIKNGRINKIRINGDFFIHPEEKITVLEKGLFGAKMENIARTADEIIEKEKIKVIGFAGKDLENAILANNKIQNER